jgi:hypothetical protein
MKRIVTLLLPVLLVLQGWSQGRTLLYTGNGWRQINIPSGQAPDNTPPASIDHVVISQSLSGLSTVTISTNAGDSLRIGGGGNSFCRSMHISNTTVIFMHSLLSDLGPPVNVYTNNGGYVVIDSGAVLEKGRFFLYGGDPAIKDLRVENSKFGNQTTHNTDWTDIYIQDSGRASFINSSFEGIALETKLHESTGGLYAENSTFSATRFILHSHHITNISY